MNHFISLSILICLLFFSSNTFAQSEWKQEKSADGITVSSKQEAGKTFKTYKGTMLVKTTEDAIINHMRKISNYTNWMHGTLEAKLLKPESSDNTVPKSVFDDNDSYTFYIYTVNDAAPLDQRDVITKTDMSKLSDGSVVLKMTGDYDYIPAKEGYVRVKALEGKWHFERTDDPNVAKITYQLYSDSDVAFWVPSASVNAKTYDIVAKSMANMKRALE